MKRDRWNKKWRERLGGNYAEPNRFLVAEVEDLEPGRALDLACGVGRNALWLAERGWQVTAVDYSEVALAAARRRAAERDLDVDWVLADVTDWEPETGAYDLVCVMYLQVPPDDRRRVLRRAASALSPAGTLLVVGHHLRNLIDGVGGPSSADVLFAPEDVAADLNELLIERADTLLRPVETDQGVRDAIDALVRARHPVDARG